MEIGLHGPNGANVVEHVDSVKRCESVCATIHVQAIPVVGAQVTPHKPIDAETDFAKVREIFVRKDITTSNSLIPDCLH